MDTERAPEPERPDVVSRVLIALLEFYRRWISPLFGPTCRFHPTCSAYAVEALRTHGPLRGVGLTLVRLVKCAPWHPGGLDPVPPRADRRPETLEPGPSGHGADHPRTPDAGTAAPTTEEQASC